jgi:hypothetical protein
MGDPMRAAMIAIVAAGLIAGCSPKPAPANTDAKAADAVPDSPAAAAFANVKEPVDSPDSIKLFYGAWKVTDAAIASFYDGSGAKPAPDPELIGKTVVFAPTSVSGSKVLACSKTIYSAARVPTDFLFEGNLKNPVKDAADLGFTGEEFVSLTEGCDSRDGDLEFDFPMVDQDTILLGLNNMIYTLKRVAS